MLSVSTQIARGEDLTSFEQMLQSVAFADELVIFNMERQDPAALALFKQYHARVVNVKTPKIVEEIRSRQIQEARGDWVLIMDYDEIVTGELREEIKALVDNLASCSAYAIPRDNFSLGYPLRHGGWERDYVVRLIRRTDFVKWPSNIHSSPVMKGSMIKTLHAMEHHKDASLAQMVEKTNRYSDVEAKLFLDGHLPRVTPLTFIRKSSMEFLRRYFFKLGFLDGAIGLLQSLYQSYSVFITYAKLYELQRNKK